jgi:hypothetical protein
MADFTDTRSSVYLKLIVLPAAALSILLAASKDTQLLIDNYFRGIIILRIIFGVRKPELYVLYTVHTVD